MSLPKFLELFIACGLLTPIQVIIPLRFLIRMNNNLLDFVLKKNKQILLPGSKIPAIFLLCSPRAMIPFCSLNMMQKHLTLDRSENK